MAPEEGGRAKGPTGSRQGESREERKEKGEEEAAA